MCQIPNFSKYKALCYRATKTPWKIPYLLYFYMNTDNKGQAGN